MKFKEEVSPIYFPVYNFTIYVVRTNDIGISRRNRADVLGKTRIQDFKNVGGLCSSDDENECFIFLHPKEKMGVIVHEAYHAIRYMFEYYELEQGNENIAYYLQYLIEQIENGKH